MVSCWSERRKCQARFFFFLISPCTEPRGLIDIRGRSAPPSAPSVRPLTARVSLSSPHTEKPVPGPGVALRKSTYNSNPLLAGCRRGRGGQGISLLGDVVVISRPRRDFVFNPADIGASHTPCNSPVLSESGRNARNLGWTAIWGRKRRGGKAGPSFSGTASRCGFLSCLMVKYGRSGDRTIRGLS